MNFSDVVRKRRMVRNFTNEPIEPVVVERMLDLARRAPSAGYTQAQRFVVVTRKETRLEIARLCGEDTDIYKDFDPFISVAPVLIVPCTSRTAYYRRYEEPDKASSLGSGINWSVPYWFMDAGAAIMILLLAAVDEGLAASFASILDPDALRLLLRIPYEVIPMGVIAIGCPSEDKPSPSLKRLV